MTENDNTDARQRLRPNRSDPLHDQQLLHNVQAINEQTMRALGPLPPGGLPVEPKRKPQLPRPAVPPVTPVLPPADEDTTMQWKSVAAVAALATGSTLAACGANSTAPHVDPPAAAVPNAPASVQMPPVEVAPPAIEATEAKPTSPADENAPEPARGAAIPAAQLRRQTLMLLGSFQNLEDLWRENVERSMQIELTKRLTMEDGYQYFGMTTEGWGYRVGVSRLGRMDEPPTILIDLDEGVEPWTDQQPTYCTLAFEPLAKELVAMGYEQDNEIAKFKGNEWWNFRKKLSQSDETAFVMAYVYRMPDDENDRFCIKTFEISGE